MVRQLLRFCPVDDTPASAGLARRGLKFYPECNPRETLGETGGGYAQGTGLAGRRVAALSCQEMRAIAFAQANRPRDSTGWARSAG